MGRYTGPKTRVSRRYGVPIFGSSKALERKNYPPGMHGPRGARRKQSDYAIALGEKQKLRYQYGLLEKQFRRIFQSALRKRGVTGETLLQLLETRLDNVVYRLGLANTRSAARQLVAVHAEFDRLFLEYYGRRPLIDQFAERVGNLHQFVDAFAPLVTGLIARVASFAVMKIPFADVVLRQTKLSEQRFTGGDSERGEQSVAERGAGQSNQWAEFLDASGHCAQRHRRR